MVGYFGGDEEKKKGSKEIDWKIRGSCSILLSIIFHCICNID